MFEEKRAFNTANPMVETRSISTVFGYITNIVTTGDEEESSQTYAVLVEPEDFLGPPDEDPAVLALEEPIEHLAATYGAPEDLIGLRVRIDYFGVNWKKGVARLVSHREPPVVGSSREVPSRGFRYAVAGGGSV